MAAASATGGALALSSTLRGQAPTPRTLASDRHRPRFHLMPPSLWLNDPNGPLHFRGRYHLFYQYAPAINNFATKYWGHAVSTDLVHWKNVGIALAPTPGGPDKNGCWTGSAVIVDGIPTIVYTGATWSAESERAERAKGIIPERQMVAIAADPNDPNLTKWIKIPENPVLAAPPEGIRAIGWRDPAVWKEGDAWYMTIGCGEAGKGGIAPLYRSKDVRSWTYLHPLAVARPDPSQDPARPGRSMLHLQPSSADHRLVHAEGGSRPVRVIRAHRLAGRQARDSGRFVERQVVRGWKERRSGAASPADRRAHVGR